MIYAGVVLLVALTAGLTAFGAYIVWRAGFVQGWRRAREAPPACPKCGYNMSGLRHCRCPECGTEYSLDQLWLAPLLKRRPDDRKAPDANAADADIASSRISKVPQSF